MMFDFVVEEIMFARDKDTSKPGSLPKTSTLLPLSIFIVNYYSKNGGFLMANSQDFSHSASIPCIWAVPLEVSSFTAPVAGLTHSSTRDLGDWSCRFLTETGSVPLPVAISTVQLPAGSIVMEVSLVAFRQTPSVLLCWCRDSRSCCGMNNHNLLFLGRVLR